MLTGAGSRPGRREPQTCRPSGCALIAFGFAAVAAISTWFHATVMPPNHDSMALLISAERILAGGRYYSEVLEVNPPLILIVLSPALAIAHLLSISREMATLLWVEAVLLASVALARPWLARLFRLREDESGLLALAVLACLNAVPGDFGQREQLLVACALPGLCWFVWRELDEPAPSVAPPWAALTLAALGFLLKPHALVIPALMIGASAIRVRSWRPLLGPPSLVFAAMSAAYAAALIFVFPEYFQVAALASELYGHLGKPPYVLAFRILPLLTVTAFLLAAFESIEPEARYRRIARYLALIASGGVLSFLLQGKGFSYHYLPAAFANLGLIALGAGRLAQRWRLGLPRTAAAALMAALLLPPLAFFGSYVSAVVYQPRSNIEGLGFFNTARELAARSSLLVLDTAMGPAFPTVGMIGAEWASRSPHLWLLPGIVTLTRGDAEDRERAARYRSIATAMVAEDLARHRPQIVAVNLRPGLDDYASPPDLLAFFLEDPGFARLWKDYDLARSIPGWEFYRRRQ